MSDGTNTYAYDIENRLVQAVVPKAGRGTRTVVLQYGPLGRLWRSATDVPGYAQPDYLYDRDPRTASFFDCACVSRSRHASIIA